MCWKPPYKRLKTKTETKNITQYVLETTIQKERLKMKTDETKNIAQYVLETTILKTQDKDRRNKKHNTICVGNHHTKDSRRRQTKQKT